jgi:FKBP-type peptidyl-prolyl cis-trans isomerase
MNEEQLRWVEQGLHDGVLGGEPKVPVESYGPKVNAFVRERLAAIGKREGDESDAFVEAQAKEAGAVRTDSGLVYRELRAGTGESPKATTRVKVHYHGTLRDGKVFDSSVERKTPATFALNQVIPCWTEGVQRMKVGGKSRLVCPAKLAYGERGAPPHIRPGAALVFEVELLGIEE